ncbi:hypothetical protein DRW03_15570 [Corallococcus sp. H22C18031201]|nr:hypothetical protein DRW03_15570 [Corallococcus sp. H22C18031201]
MKFCFVADPGQFRPEGSHIGRVPLGIVGKEQLMRALAEALRMPDWFGMNWDALSDCLRDLSWLPPGRIVLVHEALPVLTSEELSSYVDLLAFAAGDWKPLGSYELAIVLPEWSRHRVLELLHS